MLEFYKTKQVHDELNISSAMQQIKSIRSIRSALHIHIAINFNFQI